MSIGNRANGSHHARSDFGHLVILPPADVSSLSQRLIATRRNSCARGSLLQLRHPRPNSTAKKNISKSFDDIVDHCCYVWITLIDLNRGKSCPSRAAMANRELAPRTLQRGPGGRRKNLRPSGRRAWRRLDSRNVQRPDEFASKFKWLPWYIVICSHEKASCRVATTWLQFVANKPASGRFQAAGGLSTARAPARCSRGAAKAAYLAHYKVPRDLVEYWDAGGGWPPDETWKRRP
jgi:hypothetical protein